MTIDSSLWDEGARIQNFGTSRKEVEFNRHELIGGFVAGFQGALALAGQARIVGCNGSTDGYYVLPTRWHFSWKRAWTETAHPDDAVYSVPIAESVS